MKVLQLIDSLNAGGAERVAVNFANSLSSHMETSYLCATREEGLLKESLSEGIHYLFLDKKSTIDLQAIRRLHSFIKLHDISIVHAHSSSFFIATIVKILNPKLVLIWHEHYGNREQTSTINKFILKGCSYFFSCIIAVNSTLKVRSKYKLLAKKVYILPNYPHINLSLKLTQLYGKSGKRIVCLANLRPDKDHVNLIKSFKEVHRFYSDWTLHLVGHFYEDDYYSLVKENINLLDLEDHVFMYGSCPDVFNILNQSTIGVLASRSEGLPIALLEYGLAKLPVITTDVGDCNKVISNNDEGILIEPKNQKALAEALLTYINDLDFRVKVAENLHLKILSDFSETQTIETLIKIYKTHQK